MSRRVPELAAIAEVAEILKIPRSTARAWMTRGKLPKPVAQLRCGTIWLKADIEAMKR